MTAAGTDDVAPQMELFMSPTRADTLKHLADRITLLPSRSIIVIDGVDGSGKTTFADDLARTIAPSVSVVRASVDGFHNPRSVRYQRGRSDPEGFFLDSYDYGTFRRHLIQPFRSGASSVQTACFDHTIDREMIITQKVATSAILLIDGIFLHRDELKAEWDFSIFLRVPFEISFKRMAFRDGCSPDPLDPGNRRYMGGQKIYFDRCQPERRAGYIVDNF